VTLATVIVPTHDHGPTLLRSVPSALAQTVTELEVLVVGDGVPDETREVMAELMRADERVRFFDNPKGARYGEEHRHRALQEARGEIVCYLSDDDLWLPGHIEELAALLEDADVAHTLSFSIDADGTFHVVRQNLAGAFHREVLLGGDSRIHLSITGHTMELYRRLPGGWQPAPEGIYSDLYLWQRLLQIPGARAASGTKPTAIPLPSAMRPGWSPEQRLAELDRWNTAEAMASLPQRILDVAERDRAALDEALVSRELEVEAVREERDYALARAARAEAELVAIGNSATWRLRNRLLRVPGLRAAAKALARRARPPAAAPRDHGRTPEP
jgi:hypothetical protein